MWWNFPPKTFSPKSEANWSSSFAMQTLFTAKTCHITTFKLKLMCAMHSMQKAIKYVLSLCLSRRLLCVQMWKCCMMSKVLKFAYSFTTWNYVVANMFSSLHLKGHNSALLFSYTRKPWDCANLKFPFKLDHVLFSFTSH
jgi:hypothetical protein